MSERFNKGFQFARFDDNGDFSLVTATIVPCLDAKEPHPGYRYDEEHGTPKKMGDGFFVDTDKGDRLVLDVRDDRIMMRDDEGTVTLRRIKDADFAARADAYRRAVVDHPAARCAA